MITEGFKRLLEALELDHKQIIEIDRYLSVNKARLSADIIEYPDGTTFYSEYYLALMMERERDAGRKEGRGDPVIHKAEICLVSRPENSLDK